MESLWGLRRTGQYRRCPYLDKHLSAPDIFMDFSRVDAMQSCAHSLPIKAQP